MPGRRIILLSMVTEDAEAFIRAVSQNNRVPILIGQSETPDGVPHDITTFADGKVEAVVAQPLNWCKCDVPKQTRSARRKRIVRQESSGWSRGTRLGWWLHSPEHCRK